MTKDTRTTRNCKRVVRKRKNSGKGRARIVDTHSSRCFKRGFRKMLPFLYKPQIGKLAQLVSAMIQSGRPSLSKLAAMLPHTTRHRDTRTQWIRRFLDNPRIVPNVIMSPFARKILLRACKRGRQPVLMIDQSQLTRKMKGTSSLPSPGSRKRHEVLSVSARVGGRALPLFWIVEETSGGIGWRRQRELLELVLDVLPKNSKPPVLMGDRFYGSVAMIAWLKARGWGYRLRLKGSLVVFQDGGEITLRECARLGERGLVDVQLTRRKVGTNIGIVHEKGHEEPWIIAMDCRPNEYRTLDYGMRWGIECMHSDLKTRGFNVEESQLKSPDRLSRLLLVMALAMYWCVSTGMHEATYNKTSNEKRAPEDRSANYHRSKVSFMTRGLLQLQHVMSLAAAGIREPIPPLFNTKAWIPEGA